MEEQLIKFQTAKLAKEKGFDILCGERYMPNGTIQTSTYKNHNNTEKRYSVPTQSLLQKWFREKHNIHIIVISNSKNQYFVDCRFSNQRVDNDYDLVLLTGLVYETYEEALEVGLIEALKLI